MQAITHFFCGFLVADHPPAAIKSRPVDPFPDAQGQPRSAVPVESRRGHQKFIVSHPRQTTPPTIPGPRTPVIAQKVIILTQSQTCRRSSTPALHTIQVRTAHKHLVHDVLTIADVGDVDRLIDDGHVLCPRQQIGTIASPMAKIGHRHEVVVAGSDAVISVRPGAKTNRNRPARIRRQRRPADVGVRLPPGDPGGPPLHTRHPIPKVRHRHPTAVVVSGPAKRLVGNPSPAALRMRPITVNVGPPVGLAVRLKRLPAVAVAINVNPVAIRSEGFIKKLDGDFSVIRPHLGRGKSRHQHNDNNPVQRFHGKNGVGGSAGLDADHSPAFTGYEHSVGKRPLTVLSNSIKWPHHLMANTTRPRLTKLLRQLNALVSFSPSLRQDDSSRVARGSLDSPRQREVQLELDLFDRRKQPWFFTD